ncbi:MAG: DUF222 domain-containing protein [Acidimicrobiales bacterium]|nr:DUF222 domain-containing protein [Acidimicrobiales bacterium]
MTTKTLEDELREEILFGSARPRDRRYLEAHPDERIEAEIVDLNSRLSIGTYELLVLVGEFDIRGIWGQSGFLSCAAWLADQCEIEISTARCQVRVAKAMRAYPLLDQAMARGDISYAKARILVASLSKENVEALVDIAAKTPSGQLGAAIAAWSQRNEDEEQIRARQMKARSLKWRTDPDGMVVITARLIPEDAAQVCAAIEVVTTRSHAPAGASLANQRADSLVKIATDGGSAMNAEVVIHVNETGNSLPDGTPLSDGAVTKLLPEAFISLLLHDNERYPIDASPRRRSPTRRQKRVIDGRHEECQHLGCHSTDFLEYDHIEPYSQGGETVLDNLQRLCDPHNRAKT